MVFMSTITFTPAFAQEADFEDSLKSIFDWINEVITPSITDQGFDNTTVTNYKKTLDSGTDAGKAGVSLWWGIHAFFVDLIFAGATSAELGIDKDLIVIVSMLAVFALVIGLIFHIFKENTKIAVIVIGILLALGVMGIVIEF